MKPSFALNLTEDGVTLLHRTGRGWMDVGHASFSDPDLPAALEYLRSTAMGLSPKGIAAKVVIPNSQILYTQVTAPGPDEEERRAQIAAALEGRTPYAVSDLVFDWSGDGPEITVAVVARETLQEAEAFATEHRFNPVSFVAIPESDLGAEPFFGLSSVVETIVPKPQEVERDETAIKIVTRDLPKADPQPQQPEPEPKPEPAVTPKAEAPPAPKAEPEPVTPPAPPPAKPKPAAADPAPQLDLGPPPAAAKPAPQPQPEQRPEPAQKPDAATAEAPKPQPEAAPAQVAPQPAPQPVQPPPPPPPPAPPPPAPAKPAQAPEQPAPPKPPAPAQPAAPKQPAPTTAEVDEAPMAIDVAPEEDLAPEDDVPPMPAHLRHRVTAPDAPLADDDLPPAPSSAAQAAFASRRSAELAPATPRKPGPVADPRQPAVAKPVAHPNLDAPARGAAPKAPSVERPAGAKPAPKFSYDDPVPPPPRLPGDPPAAPASTVQKAGKSLGKLGALVTAPGIAGSKGKRPSPAKPAPAKAVNPAETTTTGINPDALGQGLGARRLPQRGKPRHLGLILTGILLLFLAVVAAWSSLYLTRADDATDTQTAEVSQPPLDDLAAIDAPDAVDPALPTIDDEAAADGQDEADIPTPTAEAEPVIEPSPQTAVETDAADAAPPGSAEQDEIFLAGMDSPPSATDPLTLPPPASAGDVAPDAPMPPPPFGTVYQFDADGRIVPTAEGIMTPEGVMLVAGAPPRQPASRPDAVTAAAAALAPQPPTPQTPAAAADVPAPDQALAPADTFGADPALADGRPRSRPDDLAPTAPAAGEDDASLAPAEDSRFASLRPRLRPAAVLAAGEESRRATEAASLASQAALAAAADQAVAEANADGSISPLAVSVSRVPAPRPRNLSRAVEAAVAAATQPASRSKTPEPPAAEEGDDEPEVASAAPRIPTKTSVAKQATFVNAINLSKVNLIGVYGSQSQRYALIRQSNGRYKKVRVGDRFDGGTVKAITASEVRYQKGGRLISLAMPKG